MNNISEPHPGVLRLGRDKVKGLDKWVRWENGGGVQRKDEAEAVLR